jgi:hypothetical protein
MVKTGQPEVLVLFRHAQAAEERTQDEQDRDGQDRTEDGREKNAHELLRNLCSPGDVGTRSPRAPHEQTRCQRSPRSPDAVHPEDVE